MSKSNIFETAKIEAQLVTGRTGKSPVARINCSEEQRKYMLSIARSITPEGHADRQYLNGWIDYTVAGQVSVRAFVRMVLGDKKLGYSQAWDTGVIRRKNVPDGKNTNDPIKPPMQWTASEGYSYNEFMGLSDEDKVAVVRAYARNEVPQLATKQEETPALPDKQEETPTLPDKQEETPAQVTKK